MNTLEIKSSIRAPVISDKSTVMSNVRGRSVITNTKEVVISVKNNLPNSSQVETENASSAGHRMQINETAISKETGKRLIGTAQTVVSNIVASSSNIEQVAQSTSGMAVKDGIISTSFEFGKASDIAKMSQKGGNNTSMMASKLMVSHQGSLHEPQHTGSAINHSQMGSSGIGSSRG